MNIKSFLETETALSIIETMELWRNPKFTPFLENGAGQEMDFKWFQWFISSWRIARTIKKEHQSDVFNYLNNTFRNRLSVNPRAEIIDSGSRHIKEKYWSRPHSKTEKHINTVSLVSKFGFILHPSKIVPYDQLASKGINKLRGTKRYGGEGFLKFSSYEIYLCEFESYFDKNQKEIKESLSQKWFVELSDKLHFDTKIANLPSFQRKCFDALLMRLGRMS